MLLPLLILLGALAVLGGPVAVTALADLTRRGRLLSTGTMGARGIINEVADVLRAEAERVTGRAVSLDAYALARMIRSEAGRQSNENKIARLWVALNDGRERGWTPYETVTQRRGTDLDGRFGTQSNGGRYATTHDPYEVDLLLAQGVLSGAYANPIGAAVKFLDKRSMGVQPGTRTYAAVTAEWATEGLVPYTVAALGDDLVFFRRTKGGIS